MDEVEQIKNQLDIVEVIGSYVQLSPAGRNYKAMSPFHQEKNPSFIVSPEKNIWHDFSTDEGGDIFSFVMKIEGISFPEALEMLAKKAGVTLKPKSKSYSDNKSKKNRLFAANEIAMKYYQLTLSKNKKALEYLIKQRGLKKQTIKDYCLGYAPDSWQALSKFMIGRGFNNQELKLSGLATQKNTNKNIFDIFRKRIIFPIFDSLGRCIGFSARILEDENDVAKYINTPQTLIYNKSLAIFGFFQAKEAIRTLDEVIVVEGNMDVIGLANGGQKNVVAISGTALTHQQLLSLSRVTKNIKLAFDNDEAGLKATIRAIELASELNLRIMVVDLKGAKDPDELIKKDSKQWNKLVRNAKYAMDYLFEIASGNNDINSAMGKKNYSNFLLPIVTSISDEIEKDHYIKLLSEKLGVSYEAVKSKSKNTKMIKKVTQDYSANENDSLTAKRKPKNLIVEENILKLFLSFLPTRKAIEDIDLSDISDKNLTIFKAIAKNPAASLNHLTKGLKENQDYVKILALKGEEEFADESEQDLQIEAFAQVHRLHQLNLENKKKNLLEEISKAEKNGDKATAKKLLADYQNLINKE